MEKGGEYMGAGVRWKKRFFVRGELLLLGEGGRELGKGGKKTLPLSQPFPI